MDAPKGVKPSELIKQLDEYFLERCVLDGPDKYLCKICRSPIQYAVGYFSLHDARSSNHAGGGQVEHIMLPYCLKCEGEPDVYGCIHVNEAKHDAVAYKRPCDRGKKRGLLEVFKKILTKVGLHAGIFGDFS